MTPTEFQAYIDELKETRVLQVGLGSYLVYQLMHAIAKDD